MKAFALTAVVVGMFALTAVGCAAEEATTDGDTSDLTEAAPITAGEAAKRIVEVAPASSYDGTTPKGESCLVMIQAVGDDRVEISLRSTTCSECMNLDDPKIDISVHPAQHFDMGAKETPVTKWSDKKKSLSFSVQNASNYGYVDIAVAITDFSSATASITATQGNTTITCEKLKAKTQSFGIH